MWLEVGDCGGRVYFCVYVEGCEVVVFDGCVVGCGDRCFGGVWVVCGDGCVGDCFVVVVGVV